MGEPAVVFDHVWKKFRQGERHDSLRDLVPALVRRVAGGGGRWDELGDREFWALRDVSFEVLPGEALGIIGQNGAGKSTALKVLTRILKPNRGRSEVRGRVGALIEVAAGFHADLTGRENVFLQGAIMGMSQAEVSRRLEAIVEFAGIPEFIDTPVKRYSSGMNARLGFAIAAHIDPDVLLIDEALAVGDMSFQQKCYDYLREIRRAGAAIVFVSHNMQAVASISDRVLLLRRDAPPMIGPVADILNAYRTPDTSSAGGTVRLVEASLTDEHGRPAPVLAPASALELDATLAIAVELPRCCVGFQVVRHDGVVVFDGSPMLEGRPAIPVEAGGSLRINVRFQANLLRGIYTVNLHLVDERRQWRPIRIPSVAAFTVAEETRVQGVAELEPRYRIDHGARVAAAVEAGS